MSRTPNQHLWIDALKSDRFAQGKGHLGVDGKYCCLGVCTIAVPGIDCAFEKVPGHIQLVIPDPTDPDDNFTMSLPNYARELVGMSEHLQQHLVNMNDDRNRSFAFIARFLELVWPIEPTRGCAPPCPSLCRYIHPDTYFCCYCEFSQPATPDERHTMTSAAKHHGSKNPKSKSKPAKPPKDKGTKIEREIEKIKASDMKPGKKGEKIAALLNAQAAQAATSNLALVTGNSKKAQKALKNGSADLAIESPQLELTEPEPVAPEPKSVAEAPEPESAKLTKKEQKAYRKAMEAQAANYSELAEPTESTEAMLNRKSEANRAAKASHLSMVPDAPVATPSESVPTPATGAPRPVGGKFAMVFAGLHAKANETGETQSYVVPMHYVSKNTGARIIAPYRNAPFNYTLTATDAYQPDEDKFEVSIFIDPDPGQAPVAQASAKSAKKHK